MSEWVIRPLHAIADIVTGSTPAAAHTDSWGDEIDFITPSDQVDNQREAVPTRRLSAVGARRLASRIVPAGSTNLTCIGATIGKVSMSRSQSVTNQQINSIVARTNVSDPAFIYYMVKNWSASLKDHASGSATPIVNKSVLSRFEFPLPSLRMQQRIGGVLGALDDKIAANTKLAATADELLATRFDSIVDAETPLIRLSEIADVNRSTLKPSAGGQLRYVDIASVGVGSYGFPPATAWDGAPSRARRAIRRGDTLWSTVRPNRRSHALNLSDDPLLVGSTGLAVLTARAVGWAYLYEVTRRPEFTSYLETVSEGSAYPAVRADKFGEALVPLADEANQRSFEQLAEPLREQLHSLDQENRTLADTRDTLLPQLMSGKLRVKDAQKVLENAGA